MSEPKVDLATVAVDAAYSLRKALGPCTLLPKVYSVMSATNPDEWSHTTITFKAGGQRQAIRTLTVKAISREFRRFGRLDLPRSEARSYEASCDGVSVRVVSQYVPFPNDEMLYRLDILASK